MTIKEIEARAQMERSSIRFYEREGLLTPKRLPNGYRDYTEDDLAVLLRIRLLRSLHIPLHDIAALQQGSRALPDVLRQQLAELGQQQRDLSSAEEICRAIQQEGASFASLDAEKYLMGIDRAAKVTGSSYFAAEGDRVPQVFHPWRRWLARALDSTLYSLLWAAALALLFGASLAWRGGWANMLDSIMGLALMLLLEPLLLRLTGTTPGKAIFGLRVQDADGGNLSYGAGLARTWAVLGQGLGYGIPIYSLYRLYQSYQRCKAQEIQPWDEDTAYTIRDTKGYRGALWGGAMLASYAVLTLLFLAQLLPPNRGALTTAQFVENYQYYAAYYGLDEGSHTLNEQGKWVERELDGTAYLSLGAELIPEYDFEEQDGALRRVSVTIAQQGAETFLFPDAQNTHMLLSSLAFAGAQPETGLFSGLPQRMARHIEEHSFESFTFEEVGLSFVCDVDYAGYERVDFSALWPEEGAEEYYYGFQFSITKQPYKR